MKVNKMDVIKLINKSVECANKEISTNSQS